ncbi:MAG: hypothetical protein AAB629_02705 [Patescibacteria group bacterium]
MVIKIIKKDKSKEVIQYKSVKKILTPEDIKEADRFDNALNHEIREIEKVLLEKKMLTPEARKSNMLGAWYLIGTRINRFLKKYKISSEEENLFWDHLYGRSVLISKTSPTSKISKTRNDFKIASLLAHHPITKLKKIRLWALWREIITYKAFKDERVLNWVIKRLEEEPPKTRDAGRPFLKAVSARLKRIDTTVLNNRELTSKLIEVVR